MILKLFWTILIGFFPKGRSRLSKQIKQDEVIARYITSKGYFSRQKNIVKPQAFMPPRDLRLSVFRIEKLTAFEIWEIGFKEVIEKMMEPKNLYGRADIKVKHVLSNKLQINPDNRPPRHANIINWPVAKEEQKSIAQELAAEATLELRS